MNTTQGSEVHLHQLNIPMRCPPRGTVPVNLWSRCDDLALKFPNQQDVVFVGYGAVQVIREALCEGHFGCDQVVENTTDLDIEPYDFDASFCASVAFSRGAPWQSESNAERRLEFWTWWLKLAADIGRK